jgi:hypothetical protein
VSFMLAVLVAVLAALIIAFLIIMAKAQPGRRKGGGRFSGSGSLDAASRREVKDRWQQIEQLVSVGSPSSLRQAVMDADNTLDLSLKRIGASGSTMGDRLKASGKHFSELNNVWYAHKIRNQIAHEAGYELYPPEAKKVVGHFKVALSDLGAFR